MSWALIKQGSQGSRTPLTTSKWSSPSHDVPSRNVILDLKKNRSAGGLVATVFGATGFSGKYIVSRLANSGAQIVIPFRGEEKSYTHLKVIGEVGQLIPIRYDIKDKDLIEKAISHSHIVINLLGAQRETRNFSFQDVHVDAARTIAEASKRLGVNRLIHFSGLNADLDSPSAWGRTKAEGEREVRQAFPDATILRPTWMFGVEDRLLRLFGKIVSSPLPVLLLDPDALFQPVYVRDVASAVMAVLSDPETRGKTYDLGGPQIYSYGDFVDFILEQTNRQVKGVFTVTEKQQKLQDVIIKLWTWATYGAPPFTRDQITFLKKNLVVRPDALSFAGLGITPTALPDTPLTPLQLFKR